MGVALLPDLGTERKAMNSKRDSVHQEEVHLCPAPARSCLREVLLAKKLPTHVASLTSVLTATLAAPGIILWSSQGCKTPAGDISTVS